MTTTPTSGAADRPEALRRSTAADGKTELFNLPGYPLMVRAVDFNRIHAESEMRRAALLDEMQKAALAAGQATAAQQGVAYADAHGAIMGAAYDFRDAHISGSPNQKRSAHAALESAVTHALRASHGQAPAVAAPDPVAYLYDDGSWTPAKTEEGRKLSNWMISAGSPKIGVLLASAAQPTRAVQATQTSNQRETRPCHVFTVRKAEGVEHG